MDFKALLTSKTLVGVLGSLAISLATGDQVTAVITVGTHVYDFGNIAPYLISALSSLAVYGRLVASGPIMKNQKAIEAVVDDGQRGFPRA